MLKKERERLVHLREAITKYRALQHEKDESLISPEALDSLKYELALLEEKYPEWVTHDSPTQIVAGTVLPFLKKIKHEVSQWSFNDAFTEADIRAFDMRAKKILGKILGKVSETESNYDLKYDLELKIDGLKIILTYKQGMLVTAATRGDGEVGEEVTHNILTIREVPKNLTREIDIIVEGEVYLTRSGFKKLNVLREKMGEPEFANPRNAAAGSIRQLDSSIAAERPLNVFIYDVAQTSETFLDTQSAELEYLKRLGFPVNPEQRGNASLQDIFEYWKKWKGDAREKLDYQVDGIVLKVESRADQEMLGYTGKAPRFAIAYKFPPEQVQTVLEDIVLQVGRTGKLTPVAHLRPVSVAGSVVARATLHNEDFITEKDIRIGDTVILQKAGDVIPEVVSVIKELRQKDAKIWKFPTHSSLCGSDDKGNEGKIERVLGEVAHRCVNSNSFEQQARKLIHFASKGAFDIKWMGEETVRLLMTHNLISNFDDIFDLTKDELLALERFEEKKADNVIKAISAAKKISLDKFIISLGIPHVGAETAFLLATHFITLSEISRASISRASEENLSKIEGIGPIIGASVAHWFKDENNRALISRLHKHINILKVSVPVDGSGVLSGKIVVVTGTLSNMSREEAEARVRRAGGKVAASVSSKTSFIVAGENPGSKFTKAEQLNIPILSESAFLKKLTG